MGDLSPDFREEGQGEVRITFLVLPFSQTASVKIQYSICQGAVLWGSGP